MGPRQIRCNCRKKGALWFGHGGADAAHCTKRRDLSASICREKEHLVLSGSATAVTEDWAKVVSGTGFALAGEEEGGRQRAVSPGRRQPEYQPDPDSSIPPSSETKQKVTFVSQISSDKQWTWA